LRLPESHSLGIKVVPDPGETRLPTGYHTNLVGLNGQGVGKGPKSFKSAGVFLIRLMTNKHIRSTL